MAVTLQLIPRSEFERAGDDLALVADMCRANALTAVKRGRVVVRDFRRKKTIADTPTSRMISPEPATSTSRLRAIAGRLDPLVTPRPPSPATSPGSRNRRPARS